MSTDEIPQQVLDTEMIVDEGDVSSKNRKLMAKYRPGLEAEYFTSGSQSGRLKPVGKWLLVTPAAKKMAKRLMRSGHAQEQTHIIEAGSETLTAVEAKASKKKRDAAIKQHNTEVRQRIKDLELGVTKEQLEARAECDAERASKGLAPYKNIGDYAPKEGGMFTPFLKTLKNPGYIGAELRALRAART
jgi:hypothetical protein